MKCLHINNDINHKTKTHSISLRFDYKWISQSFLSNTDDDNIEQIKRNKSWCSPVSLVSSYEVDNHGR